MIPEQPTNENVKPVLALMLPSMVYDIKAGQKTVKRETYRWIDRLEADHQAALDQASEVVMSFGTVRFASISLVACSE